MKTMKGNLFFRRLMNSLPVIGLIMITGLFSACSKDDSYDGNNTRTYNTTGNASGAQENPPTGSSGTGTLTGTYNASTNVWQYNINWSGLSGTATAVQVHGPASIGVTGALMFGLSVTTPGVSGSATGNVTLTAQQETDFLAGKCYYTILSTTHAAGEIRGQITATAN